MDSPKRFAYLFHRYYEKKHTRDEKEELFEMLRKAEHDESLRRLIDETWEQDLPDYTQKKGNALAILEHITRDHPMVPARRINPNTWVRVAATVLIIALAGFLYRQFHFHPQPAQAPLAAVAPKPSGDQYLILSDGSKVLLHKGAHIEFQGQFNSKTREVTLSGEAYFDIRHDRRPFIVHTGGVRTIVLGTAFNINALDKNVTVTVAKGKVKVENDRGEFSILKRNEQIIVDVTHNRLRKKAVDADEIITWKKPYLIMNDVSMREAVIELEQRFHVNITLVNPALGNCNVTATFINEEPLEQIINVLSKINNMEYKIINPTNIELSGEGCK
ncbi:MAG TPA: FecR domain-containing protein [Puia sp.]|nr:FecR domain-containing protein [Puia sp.]